MRQWLSAILLPVLLGACASTYAPVAPGVVRVADLQLQAGPGWNRVPAAATPWARKGTETWTRNGLSLDRLVIITGVADGEPIYLDRLTVDYPAFRAAMSDQEMMALVARTIQHAQASNRTTVTTTNMRAHRFGHADGILFDMHALVLDGPEYRGAAGAFVVAGKLNVIYFLAAVPYYFDSAAGSAQAIIEGAEP